MSDHDDTTLGFYASEAETYAAFGKVSNLERLDAFIKVLPIGGTVLELGCGAGHDSAYLLAQGFDVSPTDGTPELAQEAEKRLRRPVAVLLFGDLDEQEKYDGVWANACLLHVPRAELPAIIARIHRALRAGGVFYASYKAGQAEGRDQFNRYFNYPSADWLRQAYRPEVWISIDIAEETGGGYDRKPTQWLHVTARKGT